MENAGFFLHGVTSAVQPSLPEAAKLARGNILFLSVVDVGFTLFSTLSLRLLFARVSTLGFPVPKLLEMIIQKTPHNPAGS